MTHRFGLYFEKSRRGESSMAPRCFLYLKQGGTYQGHRAITPIDLIKEDIDPEIDKLISELEALRKEAKRKFRKLKS
jgi:hypothetical protein